MTFSDSYLVPTHVVPSTGYLSTGFIYEKPIKSFDIGKSCKRPIWLFERRAPLDPLETIVLGSVGSVCDIVVNSSSVDSGVSVRVLMSADGTIYTEIRWNATVVTLSRERSGTMGRNTSLSMPLHPRPPASSAGGGSGVEIRVLEDNFVVEVFELIGGTVLTTVVFPERIADAQHAAVVSGVASARVEIAAYRTGSCMLP